MRISAAPWRPILALGLCLIALWLTLSTWSWPFVGDASYVHYVVFLMQHGLHPYRDIVDVTLPGAYLTEQAVMATLGPGPLAWRVYDLLLMATSAAATLYLLAPEDLLAGALASVLLFALHAQDGVHMLGERDLEVGIALLVGLALLAWIRRHPTASKGLQTLAAALAGALAAIAFSIKPTAALTILVLLGWMLWLRRRTAFPAFAIVAYCVGGVLSILYPILFLWRQQSLVAFLRMFNGVVRYHASLDQRPFSYLVAHAVAPILPLVVLWLLLRAIVMRRSRTEPTEDKPLALSPDLLALALCALTGLVSYLAQRKGFAYQRYPLLVFTLPLLSRDLLRLLRPNLKNAVPAAIRTLAGIGVAAGLVLAVLYTHRAASFQRTPPNHELLADLQSYGGAALSHHVQCMDAAGGCIAALYQAQLVESTGFLHDCYMLDPTNPTSLALRERLFDELARNPPQLLIVTDSVCYSQPRTFDKYARWPEFQQYLAAHYTLARERSNLPPEHYWSRTTAPFDYRLYTRNP